jgi:hypothetical protein
MAPFYPRPRHPALHSRSSDPAEGRPRFPLRFDRKGATLLSKEEGNAWEAMSGWIFPRERWIC